MKPNKTDLKLVTELQKDGAISNSDLAAKLNVSSKTVAKRLDELIKSKFITIRAQPNPYLLGLSACAVIAIKADPSKIDHICKRLCEHFCVNLVQTFFGRFDVLTIVYFSDWELLFNFINDDLYRIDGVIQAELYLVKEVFKRYERFFKKTTFAKTPSKFDKADWTLIEELAKDGRTNPTVLAKKLGVHVTTVYRRINALIKGEAIKISAVPNPAMLRYSANAYIILDVDPKEADNICKKLYPHKEVHFIMALSNRSGMLVCVHTKNTETLYHFLKKEISSQKGLIHSETLIRSMTQKTYYGWLMEPTEI